MKDGRIGHTIDCEEAWFFHLECSSGFATLVLVVFITRPESETGNQEDKTKMTTLSHLDMV